MTAEEYDPNDLDARWERLMRGEPGDGEPTADETRARGEAAQAALDPALLLEELEAAWRAYVVFPADEAYTAAALWVAHTYCWSAFDATPYAAFLAPEKQSGKTRALEVAELTANRAKLLASVSPAALFRVIETVRPTLLIDEVDTIFEGKGEDHSALRAVLNSGYRRSGSAMRVNPQTMAVEEFSTFGPKALAGIGALPDTLADRCIVFGMKRRRPDEPVQSLRQTRARREAAAGFRERMAMGFGRLVDDLSGAEPAMPEGLSDRQADIWEPLVAIADAVGGRWPAAARRAAVVLSRGARAAEEESFRLRLLAGVRSAFDASGTDRLATESLLDALNGMDEEPWATFGLDARGLAKHLRPYEIGPRTIRFTESYTAKGYMRADFEDAWVRYQV